MRVSQRLDYALRALVLLATSPPGVYLPGAELAGRLGLPQRVVEQQLSLLAREGLLASRRGAGGGHTLARPASKISLADVVRAMEGTVLDAPKVAASAASEVWAGTAEVIDRHLASVSIDALAKRQAEIDSAKAHVYYI